MVINVITINVRTNERRHQIISLISTNHNSHVLYVIAINISKYAKESSATNKHVLENWIETYDLQKPKEMFLFMQMEMFLY